MQSEAQASNGIPSARRTVNEAIDDYVALRRKDTVTVGTIEDIEWATRIVASELGSTKLVSLSVADCDRLLEVRADGRSKSLSKPRLTRLRRSLVRVLDNEIRLGRLSRNVATLSVVPAGNVTDTERRSLTHEELQSMLDHAKHSRLILIDLCGRNGLRLQRREVFVGKI